MEEGIVKKIISKDKAEIIIDKRHDCNTCSAKNNCFKNDKQNEIIVNYKGQLLVDDKVTINITPKFKIKLYFLIFLTPLLSLLIFYYISNLFTKNELILTICTLLGFFVSVIIVWIIIKLFKLNNFIPEAVKKD